MEKLRKGDDVVVLTGTDAGKRGVILSRVDADYVTVEGINLAKKHVKPNPMQNQQGGIVDKPMPIHQSNLALFNPKTSKGDRVGIKKVDGKQVRVFKSTGETVGAAK
jgi:large subunit ribosomal protein L24